MVPAIAVLSLAAAIALPALGATQYNLVKQYQGTTFFDDWTFYDKYDNLTNGDAVFVSAKQATSDQLGYVNSAGNAIMKVDNTSTVTFNNKRNTVRITSNDRFTVGSVWVADMLHVPFGCSVWPGFWSTAPTWPNGGEIDTFEGVNGMTMDQMSLHTNPGCTQAAPMQSSTIVNSTDCSYQANANSGCTVMDPRTASYGAGFAAGGGGVWVTELASAGISIWFFPRPTVPAAISGNSSTLDTSTLGTPVANWPTAGCDIDTFFSAQNLIFDITLCGDYAGQPSTFAQTCTGECYQDYVVGNGSAYADAYFEVQFLRVYGVPGQSTVIAGSSSSGGALPAHAIGGAAVAVAALAAVVLGAVAW